MARFYGFDIGTSFIKAAVLDTSALTLVHSRRTRFPAFIDALPALRREVDPALILRSVEALLTTLEQVAPHPDGLVFCGQMHGFVLVGPGGEPVANYVSWLDGRVTPPEFEAMRAKLTRGDLQGIGNEFRPGIAAPMLSWMRQHGALPTGRATPVSIADFVAASLCGTPPVMDPTQAAAFGALRLSTLDWDEEVTGKLGLDGLCWPEVRPSGFKVGAWRGVPCYATVGDQQCALAGALLGDDELSINIGTGSQVGVIVNTPGGTGLQTRPYFNGRFIRTITHIPAGRALSSLLGLLTELGGTPEEDAWAKVEAAVAGVSATDLHASLAFYPGPCGFPGSLANLHEGNLSVGHVFRAAYESMARNYAECAARLSPAVPPVRAVFSGGIARKVEVLREATGRALALPYRLSFHPEDTLFGLLVLALAFTEFGGDVRGATDAVSKAMWDRRSTEAPLVEAAEPSSTGRP